MALYMNGTIIGTELGALRYNNINITQVFCNGVSVWQRLAPAGSQLFTASGNFTVPEGVYSVQVTVVGAGGGGANGQANGGGGYAGKVVTATVAVNTGQVINVTVGAGGAAREYANNGAYTSGGGGGNSAFGSVVAAGGSGGVPGNDYAGNGGATSYGSIDGYRYVYGATTGFGGQGCIGNGGNARGGGSSASAGGVGAGGGGACFATFGTWSGAGGRGQVLVAWNQ